MQNVYQMLKSDYQQIVRFPIYEPVVKHEENNENKFF